jgi:hypothetical protein
LIRVKQSQNTLIIVINQKCKYESDILI